ncbi:hypothetical protein FA13DRAFT_773079 [Coprinellus micaceus]|uniref:Uncharacterized protein n=1 Tax=Coprinellus micaceus TaxID=71717 RepID=A0A4Y7T4U2_COPMI|nr:hypothetical protein FA13DRAFT_773079 [Coprinellus micaceus]
MGSNLKEGCSLGIPEPGRVRFGVAENREGTLQRLRKRKKPPTKNTNEIGNRRKRRNIERRGPIQTMGGEKKKHGRKETETSSDPMVEHRESKETSGERNISTQRGSGGQRRRTMVMKRG